MAESTQNNRAENQQGDQEQQASVSSAVPETLGEKKKNPLLSLFSRGEKERVPKKVKQDTESMVNEKVAAQRQAASTQKFLTFKSIRDGIIELNNGNFRAILMVSSINFSLLSFEEQKGKVYAYQDFLNSLDFPIQILVQSRKLNIKKYLAKVKEQARIQENDLLKTQMEEYHNYVGQLVELANITTNRFYVVVPLTNIGVNVKGVSGLFPGGKGSPAEEVQKQRDEFQKKAKDLSLRVNRVIGGLSGMGLQAAQLSTQEIVELLYAWYNPAMASAQTLSDLDQLRVERS